jgi:hypothetical protein
MTEMNTDEVTWLAKEIFKAFPKEVIGLRVYNLECGCIYYQRIFPYGDLDLRVGIYRNADFGPCEACMRLDQDWENRVMEETIVYSANIKMV